mmetsp:Transcript_6198/g.13380  ORF Transcript_6198/g.13380 Transcript_6198/m.13380 type:complete len:856 (-) Transcript_6198:791-3358(-)
MSTTNIMKEAIQALYPPRPTASRRRIRRSGSSSSSFGSSFHESSTPSQFGVGGPIDNNSSTVDSSSSTTPNSTNRLPSYGASSKRNAKSRFSELLLEHGEKDLHRDWAVYASSSLLMNLNENTTNGGIGGNIAAGSCQMKQMEGRLRICSQSIVFEPRQTSRGIIRAPFRHMTVCPFLGSGNNSMENSGGILDGDGAFNNNNNNNNRTNGFGNNNHHAQQDMAAILRCDRHVVMKANNVIGPYEDVQAPVEFRFVFLHSSPTSMISLAKQLFEVESSSTNKKLSSVSFAPSVAFDTTSAPPIIPLPSLSSSSKNAINARDAIIEQVLSPTMNRPFDTTNFLHVSERPLTPNLRCSVKTPLLEKKGCSMLTDYGFYFQPVVPGSMDNNGAIGNSIGGSSRSSNKVGPSGKAHVWFMDDIRAISRRYDGMKDRGLEIYLAKQHSVLLTFENTEVRERVILLVSQRISSVKSLPLPCFTDRSFVESALELWQAGELDNFEYLLCLNSAAGRSFHDLSRYPVFPWVLSNYGENDDEDDFSDDFSTMLDFTDPDNFRDLSKPIGALNEQRHADFYNRYMSMVQQQKSHASQSNQDVPFMYGTHYSAPGYTLFYLLRVMPEHMLLLQNGKFDVPDRLFHSIDATYKSILTNPADVKELIPEFFDPDCYDFLINSMGLGLGNLQTGERVNDAILPLWANKSAKRFLRKNRAALESEYCTRNLPKWIDLIFGIASRGQGAKDAKNLFHPMAYIGPEDLEAIRNPEDRERAELQATEFGIVPDQLFSRKHPSKNENIGSWGDSDALFTRDRLRESYGVEDNTNFSAPVMTKGESGRAPSGFFVDEAMMQNYNATGSHVGANPFD